MRLNFFIAYTNPEYCCFVSVGGNNAASPVYWGRPSAMTNGYLEILSEFGNVVIFNDNARAMSYEFFHTQLSDTHDGFPIHSMGLMSGSGSLKASFGIASTTHVSTGRTRANFEVAQAVNTYPSFGQAIQAASSNVYWGNALSQVGYLELNGNFGNPAVFNKVNPSRYSFKTMDIS